MGTFRYSLILDILRNSLSQDIHVKNSEKSEKKIRSGKKPNGKPATKRKHQCSDKSTSNKAATAMKTIGKALNGNLSGNQGASCKSSAGPEKLPNKTLFKDHASTDHTTTVSGNDPNITLLDKHNLRGSLCNSGLLHLARKIHLAHFLCVARHSCTCTKTTIHSIRSFKFFVFCSIFCSLDLSHVTAKIKVQISHNFED